MDIKQMVVEDMTRAVSFILLYAFIFLVAKLVKDVLTPYKLNDELAKNDNVAIALAMGGYYFAISIIYMGALFGPTQGFLNDLLLVGGYTFLGMLLLNASRWFNEKIILNEFCDTEHLVNEHNLSVGAVHFGVYVATGLIAAGAVVGQGGGILSTIVFFVLGQISLFLFSFAYNFFTSYDVHEQLEKKNVAAGTAFGGTLIALGIIIFNGSSGPLIDWQQDLMLFGTANIMAFVFLPLIRFVMDRLVIPGNTLSKEIEEDKNLGAGILEAVVAISFAAILVILI